MSYRPHPRGARTNPRSPRGWATCQRCSFIWNLEKLIEQTQWRGLQLMSINLQVCPLCLDDPQRQLGTIILSPDPVSIMNARIEPYAVEEQTYLLAQNGQLLYAQNGSALLASNLQGTTNAGTYPG
jgi:hypothetical protein